MKGSASRSRFPAVLAGVVLLISGAGGAGGATFTVNSTADGPDVAPGNGVCAAAGGACTLRAAVMEANALAGPDLVQLGAFECQLTLVGSGEAAGDLDLTSDIEIAGAGGGILAGAGVERVMEISAGIASVHDLVLRTLGATGNPTCMLATAQVVTGNVRCDPPIAGLGFETGDLSEWSARFPCFPC